MVEIKKEANLLNEEGSLSIAGFSKKMLLNYNRENIKAGKLRIKEWDYYLIHNKNFAIALTVADNGYMGMLSASLIRFKEKTEKTSSVITLLPKGKLNEDLKSNSNINMPASSKSGDIIVRNKKCDIKFVFEGKNRRLTCKYPNFDNGKELEINVLLSNTPRESMVIATPFKEKKTAFYYNQKIIGFVADGYAKLGEEKILFDKKDSLGLLDWGRGVWTYKNTWYWGAGMQEIDGKIFGFNIGYGFGDTTNATENMLFYNGKAHKLEDISFHIPKDKNNNDDFLSPWTFTSSDKRFEMKFTPIINRHSDTNAIVLRSNQNQVFGYFNGVAVLDDGTKIKVKNLLGFAEKVFNKW